MGSGGEDPDFTPIEMLLAAIAGCSAIDVDLITGKRAASTGFEITAEGHKVRDEDGNHLTGLRLSFDVTFPDGPEGDAAREFLPRAMAMSRDRLCTVSRTVQLGADITYDVTDPSTVTEPGPEPGCWVVLRPVAGPRTGCPVRTVGRSWSPAPRAGSASPPPGRWVRPVRESCSPYATPTRGGRSSPERRVTSSYAASSRRPRVGARLRGRDAARRRPHQQRRGHVAAGVANGGRLRDPARDQPSRPLRPHQPAPAQADRPGRGIGSDAHRSGVLDVDDLFFERRPYKPYAAYAASKLANVSFLGELQRRLTAAGSTLRSVGAHPGYTSTGIQVGTGSATFNRIGALGNRLVGMPVERGALPTRSWRPWTSPATPMSGRTGRWSCGVRRCQSDAPKWPATPTSPRHCGRSRSR